MDKSTPPPDRPAANSTPCPNKRKSSSPSRDEQPAKYHKTSTNDSSPHDFFAMRRLVMSFTTNERTTSEFIATKQPDSGAGSSKDEPLNPDSITLSVQEYFAEQRLGLARAARRSSFAQERLAIKLLSEMELFRHALQSQATKHSLPYTAQQTFALARATQETLEAEKQFAMREVEAAKLVTRAKEEKLEEVNKKLTIATTQTNLLLLAIRNQHLGPDWVEGADNIFHFEPTVRQQERWPYISALENESGSEFDHGSIVSFVDAEVDGGESP